MNILFLSTRSPYPLISGHSLRTYHILRGVSQNHNVTLVTFVQLEDESNRENVEHLKSFCNNVFQFKIPVDISRIKLILILLLNVFSLKPFTAQKYKAKGMELKIEEIINEGNIDLIHVDMLHLSVYLNCFKQLPKILVNHNVESMRLYRWFQTERNILKKAFLGLQWLKLRKFERSAMEKFDSCVVVSEIDKELLMEMGISNKIFVVPNGTDTEFFKPSERPPVDDTVLWLGHMDVHTNKDAVLYLWREIYPILQREYSHVQIIFVGTSPPIEISAAAKHNSQIRVTGFVDDIRPYVDKAAVMVTPIRIGSGTRIKILDSMAMGKAIVSTSIGCEGLHVSDGENILIADDPKSFADKIIKVLTNPSIRINLEKNARKHSQSYDWDQIVEKQEIVYQEAIKKKGLGI
ncbi:glycosyltransferase [Thermodesulfobacteriota bacterium]